MQRITWAYPEIIQWEIPMPERRSLIIEQDFMLSAEPYHRQHFLVPDPDAEEYWRVVNSYAVDDMFRDRRIYAGKVRLYRPFGMVSVMGKLFSIRLRHPENGATEDELCTMLRCATVFRVTKVMPAGAPSTDPPGSVAGKVGVYLLSFGALRQITSRPRQESLVLTSWTPGPRTCRDWLVLLQRRARRAARARRALAFAMALHARLGAGSAAACLGSDLAGVVFGLVPCGSV